MRERTVEAVERYLTGLKQHDVGNVPFAPDVTFESPLSSRVTGVDAVRGFLATMFPVIKDIRVKRHIVEGEYVATLFDLDTTFGVIPVFDCFRVSNGLIREIRPYYDPRPITNPTQ